MATHARFTRGLGAIGSTAVRVRTARVTTRLLGLALSSVAACAGNAFSGSDAAKGGSGGEALGGGGGAANGGSGTTGGSTGGAKGGSGGEALGGSGSVTAGGSPSKGGTEPGSMAGSSAGVQTGGAGDGGEPSSGGAGGGGNPLDCSQLHGKTFGEHCYVDVTTESIHQADADAACVALARTADRAAHLLVLDSREEQAFIVQTFLNEVRDAWLGLTCSSTKHPELTDCYCVDCADTLLLSKRAVWSWLDGSTATFGWSGNNPDGGGRCSALAYNPTISVWGWVDRSCLSTSHQLEGYPLHSYRVICELP